MDEDEMIEPERMSVGKLEELIRSGGMSDGKSLAIFLRARLAGLV